MMVVKIKKFFQKNWPLMVIFLFSLIPLAWFRDGLLIAGGDETLYLNPGNIFSDLMHSWSTKTNFGQPNLSITALFPLSFFWLILQSFKFSLINIQRIWSVLLYITAGISVYYLIINLNLKRVFKIAGLVGAALYMFNMYIAINVLQPNMLLVRVALPLTLLFWIKGLNSPKFNLKFPILIGLTSLIFATASGNLAIVSLVPFTLLLYLVYFIILHRDKVGQAIKMTLNSLVFYLLFNIWWIIIGFVQMIKVSEVTRQAVSGANFTGYTFICDAFRLMGFWAFRDTYEGYFVVPYNGFFYQPLLLIITYLIPILVFVILFFKFKNKNILFFAILALVGMFLAKGINEPFGGLYKFFYEKIGILWVYREPYAKFTMLSLLAFAVLLGFSIEAVYLGVKEWLARKINFLKYISLIIPILVIFVIFGASFPVWTGQAINDGSNNARSQHVAVPDYWHEARNWFLKNDSESRILTLPKASYGHSFDWRSGISGATPVSQFILPNPIIYYPLADLSLTDLLIKELYSAVEPADNYFIAPLMGLLNIKYILQQNDLAWYTGLKFKSIPSNKMHGILAARPGLIPKEKFGKLDLYEIKDELLLPKIYVPNELVLSAINSEALTDIFSIYGFKNKIGIFFTNNKQKEDINLAEQDINNFFINPESVNRSDNNVELSFSVTDSAEYEIYFKYQGGFNDKGEVIINDQSVGLASQYQEEREILLWDYKLSGLGTCNGKMGIKYMYALPENILPFDKEKDAVYVNGKLDEGKKWDEDGLGVCQEYEDIKVAMISPDWRYISTDGKNTLYESLIEGDFSDYNTSSATRNYLEVFKNGKAMHKVWGEILGVDEIEVGNIVPRRVVIMIPANAKPSDYSYEIYYLAGDLPLPENQYQIKFRQKNSFWKLGEINLTKGTNVIKLALNKDGKNENIADEKIVIWLQKKNHDANRPEISFQKINNTRYKISIKEAEEPYYLVFSESFDPGWKASVNGHKLIEENHFMINGYANSWYINEKGDYTVVLRYTPQRLLSFAWVITGVSLLFGLCYLLCKRKRKFDQEIKVERNNKITKYFSESFIKKCSLLAGALVLFYILMIIELVVFMTDGQEIAARLVAIFAFLALVGGVLLNFLVQLNDYDKQD